MRRKPAHLKDGSLVHRWRIDKLLGEGGFGAVYLVSDSTGQYALKTEGKDARIQILQLEICVLSELEKIKASHFARIFDQGEFDDFNYMVMTLVGKSLEELVKARPNKCFSMGTAIGVGIKALEAIEDLHKVGYLHRDVKSSNFAVGRPERNELRHLYVLDFGICKKYIGLKGIIRRPRKSAGFCGTARYAPISSHINREACRRDDVESWIYMIVECIVGTLPWKALGSIREVGETKKRCHEEPGVSQLLAGCPAEMRDILKLTDACTYYDAPPYDRIYGLLRASLASNGTQEYPYDWEKSEPSPALELQNPSQQTMESSKQTLPVPQFRFPPLPAKQQSQPLPTQQFRFPTLPQTQQPQQLPVQQFRFPPLPQTQQPQQLPAQQFRFPPLPQTQQPRPAAVPVFRFPPLRTQTQSGLPFRFPKIIQTEQARGQPFRFPPLPP